MSFESKPINAQAGADLTGKLYRFGKRATDGEIVVCTTLGERADGIIGSVPTAAGDGLDLFVERLMPIEAGASFNGGAQLTTDANGRAVAASAGHYVMAIAAEPANGSGHYVTCTPVLGTLPAAGVASLVEVAAPGALPATADYVLLSVDGTDAFTLADGEEGHKITIECVAATNTPLGTLTIATPYTSQPATHVFHAVGQRITLVMTPDGWKLIDKKRAGALTVVVGTDVLTGYDLAETYNLSVTGTVSSDGTKALPNGLIEGEVIEVRCTTAASTPDGDIDGVFKSLAAAATTNAAINDTGDYFVGHWTGAAWLVLFSNSVTFS